MKSPSLRTIISASTVLIGISIGAQVFILCRIYNSERTLFDTQVTKSVTSLFKQGILLEDSSHLFTNITCANDSYVIKFDSIANHEKSVDVFSRELHDYGIICNFKFYIHQHNDLRYSRMFDVEMDDNGLEKQELRSTDLLPTIHKQHLYIQFPDKNSFLGRKIYPWLLSYLLFMLCLSAIAFFLYHFYKHRFWNGVQKEFINNFIHEFRTPLSVITIGSGVLQSNGIENDRRRFKKYARIIKEQTDHLQQKISQILELSLSGKKTRYLQRELVDINTLITNALSLVEPLIQEKKASIEFIPCTADRRLNGDSNYLTQAVVNLLDNSLKYAKCPQIRLETTASDRNYSISIRDNGIGMEKKYFKHIFRKYYRIPTGDVHNVKGFGIGLNFVKNVIDAHNGQIEVNSTPGQGTEFRIKLPLT